jgi:hypothetical protein
MSEAQDFSSYSPGHARLIPISAAVARIRQTAAIVTVSGVRDAATRR